jgi:MFS family permease
MATLSAVLAGYILTALNSPTDFVYNFLFAGLALMVSYFFLIATREQEHQPTLSSENQNQFAASLLEIIRRDKNFTWFLISRMLSPFAIMGAAFYTVYAVDELGISELQVGYLTAVLLIAQIIANPFLGWLSDKWSHRGALIFGMLAAALGGLLAALATNPNLFFLVFFLTGIANASIWTISMAMTLEFGREDERPSYIGLANSLVAPSTILVPIVGGLMANRVGYPFAFLVSSIVGVLVLIVLRIKVIDPKLLNEEYELETASTG